jgi:hypothetical protein
LYNYLRGNDIPDWCSYKDEDEGPSVRFEVPFTIDDNIERFFVCTVYSVCPYKKVDLQPHNSITVINYTRSTIRSEAPLTFKLELIAHDDEDHIWQANVPKGQSNFEAGDKVEIIAYFGSRMDVKGIGVSYGKMFHHFASSLNKDAIVVNDDEDASAIDQVAIESKRGLGDDGAESSHGCFHYDHEAKMVEV